MLQEKTLRGIYSFCWGISPGVFPGEMSPQKLYVSKGSFPVISLTVHVTFESFRVIEQ